MITQQILLLRTGALVEYNGSGGDVTIPDNVVSIAGAFAECDTLTSVTVPDSVASIGGGAFGECTSLTSITIPDSVTFVGHGAFYDCTSINATYKGQIYTYDNIDDLYTAING